ncbi:coiled-coil domain-containing protein 86-like [Limulus polyphemus]|uniref:Coiled-coil domain-containing protein 86 n=1 Tax=Limulus polyphemus TaxID=6850 RepID=A0ABM1TAD7_LIMPO|nr:coiled-coil domain-containing protein 86-like [Limulus polyphemus]XP_022252843.1 coiled-coil domain-containing protein 86-like [Limulus polyphemus]
MIEANATLNIPKGRPKSGRVWKSEKKCFSTLKYDKAVKISWKEKMKKRVEQKTLKLYEEELKAAKRKEIEEKKQRREEHRKRREENQRKAEIVQVIRNSAKIKRMSKKQLKHIRKQDTNPS